MKIRECTLVCHSTTWEITPGSFRSKQLVRLNWLANIPCSYRHVHYLLCDRHLSYFAVRPNITRITSSNDSSGVQNVSNGGLLSLKEFTPQLELMCRAHGSRPPEIIWLRDGIALQNLTGQRQITTSERGNITLSTLTLKEVQLSDAGEYTCRASTGNVSPIPGTTAWAFMVNVTGEILA